MRLNLENFKGKGKGAPDAVQLDIFNQKSIEQVDSKGRTKEQAMRECKLANPDSVKFDHATKEWTIHGMTVDGYNAMYESDDDIKEIYGRGRNKN